MPAHLVETAAATLVTALIYVGFAVRFPPPLVLDGTTVRILRRRLLPAHVSGLGLALAAGFGSGWIAHRLGPAGALHEATVVACGLAGAVLAADLWFLALLWVKGAAWWQGYRAFLSHQYGFDYFAAYRIVHALAAVAAAGLLLAARAS